MKAAGLGPKQLNAFRQNAEELHSLDSDYRRAANIDFILYLVLVLLVAFGIRTFVGEPIRVDGDSMYPTLHDEERMVVEKLSYYVSPPERGDIIVCYYPGFTVSCVKRVVGLPGESISVSDGDVYINGEELDESAYWDDRIRGHMDPLIVPEGTVFVMGDNRNNSSDSREASVGPIPFEKIVGKVVCVMWPLDSLRPVRHVNYA